MITVADVQVWNPDIDTAQAAAMIAYLEAEVVSYLGHSPLSSSYVDVYQGSGSAYLQLRHFPITAIEYIKIDGDVVDPADYEIWGSYSDFVRHKSDKWPRTWRGVIWRSSELYGQGEPNIEIAYTAGYTTTPENLVTAMAREVCAMVSRSPSEPGQLVELRTPGGMAKRWSTTAGGESKSKAANFSQSLQSVLDGRSFTSHLVS